MKTSIVSRFCLFLSFSLLLLLVSCSSESSITQPQEKSIRNTKPLAKVTTTTIDHSQDTVITLPKSGKQIIISKTISTARIKQLDTYLSTHQISTKTQSNVVPYLPDCTRYYDYYWVFEDQFRGVPGKYLGINNSIVSDAKLHNTYGFNMLLVSNNSDIDAAHSAGFHYDSLMLQLKNLGTAFTTIEAANNGGRHVGSYYIDEPVENGTWALYGLDEVADYVYPKHVILSSYDWASEWYDWPSLTWGDVYGQWINSRSNIYITCDQYHGDCNGSAEDYWGEFHDYYGSGKNLTDWLHVIINNGTGGGHVACPWINENSTSWYDLIHFADGSLAMNKLWLYAYDTGADESALESFCQTASYWGWLLEYTRQFVVVWKCVSPGGCTDCHWPSSGEWTVETSYYTGLTEWATYGNP